MLPCEPLYEIFPFIPPSVILEIVRFEFSPLDLYKLDATAWLKSDQVSQIRHIRKAQDFRVYGAARNSKATKDCYPDFLSVLGPLLVYFDVLASFAASAGKVAGTYTVVRCCSEYCNSLAFLSGKYDWPPVLQYHIQFFLKRSTDMAGGMYTGWNFEDRLLIDEYLAGHLRMPI
ncbi:hypothetical protein BDN70DRAFT_96064 [Pholiota conissans]|uniref:Uncharacterized protein n=1 Tax=Pholiota conissans TaxID=109636 RepID=A0A9P6CYT2_9AGAR|nr:hypothetical protein BDN70DRAFT_96064 [Pholiota conissans]